MRTAKSSNNEFISSEAHRTAAVSGPLWVCCLATIFGQVVCCMDTNGDIISFFALRWHSHVRTPPRSAYTPTGRLAEQRSSGVGGQEVFEEDDIGGVPEIRRDGAAGLAGYYDFEDFR